MKIAIIVYKPFVGGVGFCMMNYFRHLNHAKFQIDFLVQDELPSAFVKEITAAGGAIKMLPGIKNVPKHVHTVYRILKDGKYDAVHSNVNTLSVFPLFAAWLAGTPIRISHAHSASNPKDRKRHVAKLILRPLSRIFPTHYLACSELAGRFQFGDRKWESGSVRLVKNAIETDRFKFDEKARAELCAEFGLKDKFIVGHIGRISPQKNHQGLIEIFAEVAKKRDDAVLVMVGDGPLRKQVEEHIRAQGLEDRIVFAGERHDANRFYSMFDVFCLPSLYEGLSVVLVEAQANGLKCIISDCNSRESKLTEQVEFLPLNAPVAQWADRLLAAKRADSAQCRQQLAEAGYDITREAENLAAFYRDACPHCRSEMSYSNANEYEPC